MRITGWPLDQPFPDTFEWVFFYSPLAGGQRGRGAEIFLTAWHEPKLVMGIAAMRGMN